MYGPGLSNATIGFVNVATLLGSIPLIGWGLWLARASSSSASALGSASASCSSFLQAPVLALGLAFLLVSLAGLVGACSASATALRLYLAALLLLLAVLLSAAALGLAVSGGGGGGGSPLPGRSYREYHLTDYSPWLRSRLAQPSVWRAALACVAGSRACDKITAWTPDDYLHRDLSPVQSGCCKPPTSCTYSGGAAVAAQDEDCYRWNNAPDVLCYGCDSCKAGVLEQVRRDWHKLSLLNVVLIVILVIIYSVGCCALRNVRRAKYGGFPYGANGISSKNLPRWDYYWGRWWRDIRDQLY